MCTDWQLCIRGMQKLSAVLVRIHILQPTTQQCSFAAASQSVLTISLSFFGSIWQSGHCTPSDSRNCMQPSNAQCCL